MYKIRVKNWETLQNQVGWQVYVCLCHTQLYHLYKSVLTKLNTEAEPLDLGLGLYPSKQDTVLHLIFRLLIFQQIQKVRMILDLKEFPNYPYYILFFK